MLTIRMVAQEAGVSTATVSRALRGIPGVSEKQRDKVLAAIRKTGYHWNPMVSKMMSELRQSQVDGFRYRITWMNSHTDRRKWQRISWAKPYYQGACERADELGVLLDQFWLEDPSLDATRLNSILRARGTRGLIIPRNHPLLDHLAWDRFAVAGLQVTDLPCPLHVASSDYGHSLRIALSTLLKRGYRRIGLMLHQLQDKDTQGDWRASFLLFQSDLPARQRVPILLLRSPDRSESRRLFLDWLRKERPDAVICCDEFALKWTREGGCKVPDELGLVHLSIPHAPTEWSGIRIDAAQVSAAAIDLVTSQIARGETGFPKSPKEVLIKGHWVEGKTTRAAP